MGDIIHEAWDDKVAATLREEMIPSLKILRRIVRFTNTGFWMTIEDADDLDAMWPKLTGLLFLHQFGHFISQDDPEDKRCEDEPYSHWCEIVGHAHQTQQARSLDVLSYHFVCQQTLTTMILPKYIPSTEMRSK